jgi:ribosomal protein S14
MADLMRIVREWEAGRHKRAAAADHGLPWPDYNRGKKFHCDLCGARFDTSTGMAKHEVNGCETTETTETTVKTLPRCRVCGSYALYREPSGLMICQTCEMRK